MPDKIITQRAQGYSNQPVTVTVQIDGATILQGAVPTQNTAPPALPDFWTPELGVDAWSWTVDETFGGTQTMTVSVNNGDLYLCDTFYVLQDQPGNVYFLEFDQTQGNLTFSDPFTTVTVNGVPKDPVRDAEHSGQWVWQLRAGDEFSCTVNIESSPPTPPPPQWNMANAYEARDRVMADSVIYVALQTVPAGVDITDVAYWLVLPVAVWSQSLSYTSGHFVVQYPNLAPLLKSLQAVPEGIEITDAAYWQEWTFVN